MATYYDDNFGHYDIESQDDIDWYHKVQRESVEKVCEGCGRTVRLRPQYGICDSCADRLERGGDL
jgi:rRNA maturation endonuclease Nob1